MAKKRIKNKFRYVYKPQEGEEPGVCGSYFYVFKRNPKKPKMQLRKYHPGLRRHVVFTETKI